MAKIEAIRTLRKMATATQETGFYLEEIDKK